MACPDKVCDLTAVTATLSGAAGTFTFNEYVGEGDLITFGSTEFTLNKQYSNTKKKVRISGETVPRITITMNIFPCDPVFKALFDAHKKNTLSCFNLVVNDPCCDVRSFSDVNITSMTIPAVSHDTTQAVIELEGVPV